jgi:hypothetical protein
MLGSGGRTPFVGHFRGARVLGGVRLWWAGRIASSASVEDGWAAAEEARDAMAGLLGAGDAETVLATAAAALSGLGARWLARQDLSVLLVAADARGCRATASGLSSVHGCIAGTWRPLATSGPLVSEPGLPRAHAVSLEEADRWLAVPSGATVPTGDLAAACGVHA